MFEKILDKVDEFLDWISPLALATILLTMIFFISGATMFVSERMWLSAFVTLVTISVFLSLVRREK